MSLILPKGLEEYFDLVDIKETEECLTLCLDERNIPPLAYKNVKTISKGFFEPSSIRDFPLRGKSCFLNVRRRKWMIEETGQIVFNDWNIAHQGTRMTQELALFFKKVNR